MRAKLQLLFRTWDIYVAKRPRTYHLVLTEVFLYLMLMKEELIKLQHFVIKWQYENPGN